MSAEFTQRIILVADNASLRFGGEAALPWHYFAGLLERGCDVHLITHDRCRKELQAAFPLAGNRIRFTRDTTAHRLLAKLADYLPDRIGYFTAGFTSRWLTMRSARAMARKLVKSAPGGAVVHQPGPVAAGEPSMLYNMKAPVVIGPMNGNMSWPEAFRSRKARPGLKRLINNAINLLIPGKRRAATLLVANQRTAAGLPAAPGARVMEMVENGVDLRVWTAPPAPARAPAPARTPAPQAPLFVFIGRLIDWKAADMLPDMLAAMTQKDARIEIIGDGPMRSAIEGRIASLGLEGRITLTGWLSQADCATRLQEARALLLPSLYECGGAVVLEAMACARPVIATDWGGPADYIRREETGILVAPQSRDALIRGFAAAMDRLSLDPALAHRLGQAGRARVERDFDWQRKTDAILDIYAEALSRSARDKTAPALPLASATP